MADVPAMLTGNPAGTNRSLPPELTSGYRDRPGGTATLGIATIWIVLLGSVLALNRRIRELR